jgi:hypothetical protein
MKRLALVAFVVAVALPVQTASAACYRCVFGYGCYDGPWSSGYTECWTDGSETCWVSGSCPGFFGSISADGFFVASLEGPSQSVDIAGGVAERAAWLPAIDMDTRFPLLEPPPSRHYLASTNQDLSAARNCRGFMIGVTVSGDVAERQRRELATIVI